MIYFSYNKFVSKFADKEIFFMINAFFYKQHFQKQNQAEIGKKSSKC